jgi:hypothetical protein
LSGYSAPSADDRQRASRFAWRRAPAARVDAFFFRAIGALVLDGTGLAGPLRAAA